MHYVEIHLVNDKMVLSAVDTATLNCLQQEGYMVSVTECNTGEKYIVNTNYIIHMIHRTPGRQVEFDAGVKPFGQ